MSLQGFANPEQLKDQIQNKLGLKPDISSADFYEVFT